MTNHWRDLKNADLILINGANPAEAHPVGFQWMLRAKLDRGAKLIHADPRFTRTSAVADMYVRIRTGTDVAYFGGLINHVLQNGLYQKDYVARYTNAAFVVREGYSFKDGLFSGYNPKTRTYDTSTWAYEDEVDQNGSKTGYARRDETLQHPRTVFQLMKEHYARYTPEMVASITGIPKDTFLEVAKLVGEMGKPDKVMSIVYAVGLTHHTTGGQLIRSAAVLQLLLGNMGMPGGGVNAERGHANIQGNTDNAISWEILPGYLRIPTPGQETLDKHIQQLPPNFKKSHPNSWNYFGTNYRKFFVSLLKAWYGDAARATNDWAYSWIPKPASNASWITIFDQALKGKMEGVILSGMTATSIGPDSNQVLDGLAKLKWLVVMDPLPTTSSEFWRRPGVDPRSIQTEVFLLPTTHWIEKDGSFVNSGRWVQWKDAVLPPKDDKGARHDHWVLADLFDRVKKLYRDKGGKLADPLFSLTLPYKDPLKPTLDELLQEINGFDLKTGKRVASFASLADDGSTASGNWIYAGVYPDPSAPTVAGRADANLSKRRDGIQNVQQNDPTGLGFFHNWAWSWPLNRRVMYNRASADPAGKPWDPTRPGIQWDPVKKTWIGDVPDYPPTMDPSDPKAWLPFIMNGEGVGRIFSSSMVDGPLPEHYEPVESPIDNPLHPAVSANPAAFLYDQAAGRPNRFGKVDRFPHIATTYRLTEHEHYVTQHVPLLDGLQPQPFVEIPDELGKKLGIRSGDRVTVTSARGRIDVLALVTKRLGPVKVGGKTVYQVGVPIHWGFVGLAAERDPNRGRNWLANALTPFVGDANSRTPEFKSFLVNVEKA